MGRRRVARCRTTSSASRTNVASVASGAASPTASPQTTRPAGCPPTRAPHQRARPVDAGVPRRPHHRPRPVDWPTGARTGSWTSGGRPVAGIFVYTGIPVRQSFVPHATPSAVTDDQGRFAVPCTTAPVLLTPWTLNESRDRRGHGRWAARPYVTSPQCSTDAAPTVTEVHARSGDRQGHVKTDEGCADSDFAPRLWLNGNRPHASGSPDLHEGDAYRSPGCRQGPTCSRRRAAHPGDGGGRRPR